MIIVIYPNIQYSHYCLLIFWLFILLKQIKASIQLIISIINIFNKVLFIWVRNEKNTLLIYVLLIIINYKFYLQNTMNEQNKKYDTYCKEIECINNQNALFVYSSDHYHVRNKHRVQILHQLKIRDIVQSLPQNQQTLLLSDKDSLIKKVDSYIVQFCKKLNSFIIDKYLSAFVTTAKTELEGIKVNDAEQIFMKLQQGDHQMLKEFISCSENGGDNKYPFFRYTQNKIRQIDEGIAKEIQNLYAVFQKIIEVTFENKDDFLKVAEGQFETVSEVGKEQIRKTFKLDETSARRRNGPQKSLEIFNLVGIQSSDDIVDNDHCSDEIMRKNRKRKQIMKGDKKIKQIQTQLKRTDEKKISKPVEVAGQITQLAPDQIRINTCSYSQLTFDYIKQHYKDLTKIHIFHHKFARKEILKRLFNVYKNLKVITLNCNHEFDSTVVPQNRQSLEKIENLQLRWDLQRFLKEYQIFKFFPTKDRRVIQNLRRTNIELDVLLALKNNQSLTVNNERQIDELNTTTFKFENIKSLHYMKARQEKQRTTLPPFSKILRFNKLTQLSVLHLSEINLMDNQWQFGQFLKLNSGITTLVLSYCKIYPTSVTNPVKILQYLEALTNLKRFSYCPNNSQQYVKAQNIFCLTNLEELHLSNCNLVGSNNKTYEDSSMLREIQNLRKLTQLSLYACNPVFSDLFTYIDRGTLENIQFLNIGYTQVDNKFAMNILPYMKKLEYLNIDCTLLDGMHLLAGFQAYHKINQQESPLKYLSIESRMHKMHFSIDEFRGLSPYIPNLVYVQISNCKSLIGYGFEEYKNLKYLAVDEEQEPHLQRKASSSFEIINLN